MSRYLSVAIFLGGMLLGSAATYGLLERYNVARADAFLLQASTLFDKKEFLQAAASLNRAVILRPHDFGLYDMLGRTYEMLNEPEMARSNYEAALDLVPPDRQYDRQELMRKMTVLDTLPNTDDDGSAR